MDFVGFLKTKDIKTITENVSFDNNKMKKTSVFKNFSKLFKDAGLDLHAIYVSERKSSFGSSFYLVIDSNNGSSRNNLLVQFHGLKFALTNGKIDPDALILNTTGMNIRKQDAEVMFKQFKAILDICDALEKTNFEKSDIYIVEEEI